MKQNKTKELLIETLGKHIPKFMEDENSVNELSTQLSKKHNLNTGKIMYYLNDPKRLNEAETAELALIAEQVSLKLDTAEELSLDEWFNVPEIKEIRQYYYTDSADDDEITLPLEFNNVDYLGDGVYQAAVDFSVIGRLYKYDKLNYNFEIQREGRFKKKGDTVIQEMKIYKKNVKEIKEKILQGKLKKTALAYNCATDTSEDASELELIYDDKSKILTLTKGTRIDVLDGMHRTMGIYEAYMEKPEIEGKITVLFSNYTTAQAKEYQVELAKATPFNKVRAKQLAETRYSDELVNRLNSEGLLRDKISSTNNISRSLGQLTSFEVLSDAFELYWKPEKRSDIKNIIKAFNEYLEYLFEYYEDNINDKENLLFSKYFFIGHVILAKAMHDKVVSYEYLMGILGNADEYKDNSPKFDELELSKKFSQNTNKYKKSIANFFMNL